MKKTAMDWIEYWDTETLFTDFNWRKNMQIFIEATQPILNYNAEDVILDIGCGPGYLEMFLKDRVKEIHGADTSQRYLNMCRERFGLYQNLFFYQLDRNNYTDLSFFKDKRFSIIICLSVIQYYKSIDDVEKLIREVQRIALPDARFLIADILTSPRLLADTWGVLKTALAEKCLLETLIFLVRARASAYYQARSSQGLLVLSLKKLKELVGKLNLDAEILSTRLTTNEGRKHLLIRF